MSRTPPFDELDPEPEPVMRDVCFDNYTTAPTDLQLAAQRACFENRRNENNGFRVYRLDKSSMKVIISLPCQLLLHHLLIFLFTVRLHVHYVDIINSMAVI